jgi:exopolysaccharide biosynthesis polyprenyl glycosylphosphotransferase
VLQVLRHYLPLRKALLIASETLILALVVWAVMSAHLWSDPPRPVRLLLANGGYTQGEAFWRCLFSSVWIAVMAQAALYLNELYDFRVSSSRSDRSARYLSAAGLAAVLAVVSTGLARLWELQGALDFPGLTFSRTAQSLVFAVALAFLSIALWRRLFHRLLSVAKLNERVLILGTGDLARTLIGEIGSAGVGGYQVAGVLPVQSRGRDEGDPLGGAVRYSGALRRREDDDSQGGGRVLPLRTAAGAEGTAAGAEGTAKPVRRSDAPRLLPSEEPSELEPLPLLEPLPGDTLHGLCQRLRVDDIVVALQDRRGTLPTEDLLRCRLAGLTVAEGEALYERVTGKIAVGAMRPSYLIFNQGFVKHPFSEAAKRAFDILCALVGLALAWPFMLATALAIKLDSPGPVLYRQERSGRFGRPIVVNKFRSMRQDAEKATGPTWAQEGDPRITKVGRFIRKTRLDELPQLFNVLGGSMSMVGPRPERPVFIAELKEQIPYYDQRHIVKPGLTGWAQINYPYGNTVEDALQKLQYDLFYIKYGSVPFDLTICINTIKTVLLRKGT